MGNFRIITNKPQAGASGRQVGALGGQAWALVGEPFAQKAVWLGKKKPHGGRVVFKKATSAVANLVANWILLYDYRTFKDFRNFT